MNIRTPSLIPPIGHPIELIKGFVDINDWPLHHVTPDEISIEMANKWSVYTLTFTYDEIYSALHTSVQMDILITKQHYDDARKVITTLNRNIWMGHFDLITDEGTVMFRHVVPLRGTGGATPEQIKDLIDIALGECERAYPALFQIATGVVSAETATDSVLMETVGSA